MTVQLLLSGLAIGLVLALARLSHVFALRWAATVSIEVIRGIPLLVLLLFFYFGLQDVIGRSAWISEYWSAVAAFGLCYS
jgi:His/Glu/Gln/Arg/opine family amino acid ABC transporter permease subunit